MIRSFKNKGLRELFAKGRSRKIEARFVDRLLARLHALHAAKRATDLDVPGFDLHQMKGARKGTWSLTVTGAWRLTFRFHDGEAHDVDFEQYH